MLDFSCLENCSSKLRSDLSVVGTAAQCEQTRKTICLSPANNASRATTPLESSARHQTNRPTLVQQNQQRQCRAPALTMSSRPSTIAQPRAQVSGPKTTSTSTNVVKDRHMDERAHMARDSFDETDAATNDNSYNDVRTRSRGRTNCRKNAEDECHGRTMRIDGIDRSILYSL